MFTRPQQAKYRPLVSSAWLAHCRRSGQTPNSKAARDSWYRQQLHEAAGVFTTKELDPVEGFDQVMLHFAIIANDEYWINRCTQGAERRMRYQIRRYMQDLSWLEKQPVHWSYIRAMHKQSAMLPANLEDTPAQQLRVLLAMLDTHIRRICKDYDIRPCELPTRAHPRQDLHTVIPDDSRRLHIGHDLDKQHCAADRDLPF